MPVLNMMPCTAGALSSSHKCPAPVCVARVQVLRFQPQMLIESELLSHTFQCGCAALHLQHKEAGRSALRFFDNLIHLFMHPGRGLTPLSETCIAALRGLLVANGQQLVTAIVQAIAGVLPANRVRFFTPVLKQLVECEPNGTRSWVEAAIKTLPSETHVDGTVLIAAIFSPEALVDDKTFHAAADAFSEACRRKRAQIGGAA